MHERNMVNALSILMNNANHCDFSSSVWLFVSGHANLIETIFLASSVKAQTPWYCNYSKRTIQFKHVHLRSNIRVWIQFSFLSNSCQLQLQSPVGTPIYPTFEERKDEYLCFRKYLCENEWNVVHQISNLGDLLFRKSNITPPSHPMGDTLFQNKKKKDRRAVLFANYLIVQY